MWSFLGKFLTALVSNAASKSPAGQRIAGMANNWNTARNITRSTNGGIQ